MSACILSYNYQRVKVHNKMSTEILKNLSSRIVHIFDRYTLCVLVITGVSYNIFSVYKKRKRKKKDCKLVRSLNCPFPKKKHDECHLVSLLQMVKSFFLLLYYRFVVQAKINIQQFKVTNYNIRLTDRQMYVFLFLQFHYFIFIK